MEISIELSSRNTNQLLDPSDHVEVQDACVMLFDFSGGVRVVSIWIACMSSW